MVTASLINCRSLLILSSYFLYLLIADSMIVERFERGGAVGWGVVVGGVVDVVGIWVVEVTFSAEGWFGDLVVVVGRWVVVI